MASVAMASMAMAPMAMAAMAMASMAMPMAKFCLHGFVERCFDGFWDLFFYTFGSIVGPFGVHFGTILGPFWVRFGSILAPFWGAGAPNFTGGPLGPPGGAEGAKMAPK